MKKLYNYYMEVKSLALKKFVVLEELLRICLNIFGHMIFAARNRVDNENKVGNCMEDIN